MVRMIQNNDSVFLYQTRLSRLKYLGYEYKVNDIIFKGHTETSGTIRIEWVKEGDEKYYEFNKGEQVF